MTDQLAKSTAQSLTVRPCIGLDETLDVKAVHGNSVDECATLTIDEVVHQQ